MSAAISLLARQAFGAAVRDSLPGANPESLYIRLRRSDFNPELLEVVFSMAGRFPIDAPAHFDEQMRDEMEDELREAAFAALEGKPIETS